MEKLNLRQSLYTGMEEFTFLRDPSGKTSAPLTKQVNRYGPMGTGMAASKYRNGAASTPKYSAIAVCLEKILYEHRVNALCSEEAVYGEYTAEDGEIYRFVCTEGKVSYEHKCLKKSLAFIPLYLFSIRNDGEIEELSDAFNTVKESMASDPDGLAGLVPVMLSCDTYYYAIAKKMGDVDILEDDLQMETVKASVRSGLLNPFASLKGVKVPDFTGITVEAPKTERENISNEEMWEKMRAGGCTLDYKWDDKQKSRIPALSTLEGFVPSNTFFSVAAKVRTVLTRVLSRLNEGATGIDAIGKDYLNLFLTGKPGTGKTVSLYALGAALGLPVYTIPMTKNTEEDVFQGMNKVIDGTLKFVSTDFLDAYTNGGIILLEEINLPDPSVTMGALGQAVEFPFTLMQDGYIPVKRHPMCVIVGTMNIGTYGSKGVNQALSSRFRHTYVLNDPTKEDFIGILMKSVHGSNKKQAGWVFNAYDRITEYLKSPSVNADDVCLNVTLRGCIGALENIIEGEEAKEAVRNTLIGKISEADLDLSDNVFKEVVSALPELY